MTREDAILVVNAGSSSLKFQVFTINEGNLARFARGQISGIGIRPKLTLHDGAGALLRQEHWSHTEVPDLPAAIERMSSWVRGLDNIRLRAIGHRVVHGGPNHADPVRMTPDILRELAAFQELAPLHQPNNLAPIRTAMQIAPNLPQIACFDTAFHRSHARQADCYALPLEFYESGIRRYGFHGLSYEFIAQRLVSVDARLAQGKVIVAHLGSGASMCALQAGASMCSTMGFTALDGIPMGTRPGQVDPGVVLYLMRHMGMSHEEVTDLLYHRSGLLGLSGLSSDMRVLLQSGEPQAQFAIAHFAYQCGLHAGMLAAALQGVDGVVFTAGIGENAPRIRQLISEKMSWLGLRIDASANSENALRISASDSEIAAYVIPTDEEFIIAKETVAALAL